MSQVLVQSASSPIPRAKMSTRFPTSSTAAGPELKDWVPTGLQPGHDGVPVLRRIV